MSAIQNGFSDISAVLAANENDAGIEMPASLMLW